MLILLLVLIVFAWVFVNVFERLRPSYDYGIPNSEAVQTLTGVSGERWSPTDRLLFFYWTGE